MARFIDASLKTIAGAIRTTYVQWDMSVKNGFLQKLDPRVKVLFLAYFAIIVSITRNLPAQGALSLFILVLAVLSRIDLAGMYRRVLLFAFLFGFLVALPSVFNIFVQGEVAIPIAELSRSYRFWVYEIPRTIGITHEGLSIISLLTLRVANSIALALLILYTTPFLEIIRALKVFRVPDLFLMVIMLSYKFIFIFSLTVENMYLSLKSRLVGPVQNDTMRKLVAGRIYYVFKRSWKRYEETYSAMVARGFDGDITLSGFRRFTSRDAAAGAALLAAGIAFIIIPRLP